MASDMNVDTEHSASSLPPAVTTDLDNLIDAVITGNRSQREMDRVIEDFRVKYAQEMKSEVFAKEMISRLKSQMARKPQAEMGNFFGLMQSSMGVLRIMTDVCPELFNDQRKMSQLFGVDMDLFMGFQSMMGMGQPRRHTGHRHTKKRKPHGAKRHRSED